MRTEPIPIQNYVHSRFAVNPILGMIGNWRVDPEDLQKIVIKHFEEMGIYFVYPRQEKIIRQSIVRMLLFSPEILGVLSKKDLPELAKQRAKLG